MQKKIEKIEKNFAKPLAHFAKIIYNIYKSGAKRCEKVLSGAKSIRALGFERKTKETEVIGMFGGEYRHTLDAKNRIFIPAKLREDLGETFVVAKDVRTECLKVYSLAGWEAYLEPILKQNRNLKERALRFLSSSMMQVSPDSHGRITLPKELVEHAGIEGTAVVVGCFDYAEIWAEAAYARIKEQEDAAQLLAELESLGL